MKNVKLSLKECVTKWAKRENVDEHELLEWYNKVIEDTSKAITRLSKKRKTTKKMILKSPSMSNHLLELQKEFVFVPTDKASTILLLSVRNFMWNNL